MMDIKQALIASGKFDAYDKQGIVIARRRRILPLRGLFRILFPLSIVRAKAHDRANLSVRPDAWGWLMLFVCVMGVVIEFTMPRVKYPRAYPPAFVFAFTGIYIFNLILDLYLTHKALRNSIQNPR